MKRLSALLATLALVSFAALGQNVQTNITAPAGSLRINGRPINGTLFATAVDSVTGQLVAVHLAGGGLIAAAAGEPTYTAKCSIVAGGVSGACSVPDAGTGNGGAGFSYNLLLRDSFSGLARPILGVAGISGPGWALDQYSPAVSSPLPAQSTWTTASGPPVGLAPAMGVYQDSAANHLYVACNGAWCLVTGPVNVPVYGVTGAKADGTTDDSAALNAACLSEREVWLTATASYYVGGNLTLANCAVRAISSAQIVVGTGAKLTLLGGFTGPLVRHFTLQGTGSVVFGSKQDSVRPEWFGAVADGTAAGSGTDDTLALQQSLASVQGGGTVLLQCAGYTTSAALTITSSSVNLYGGDCVGLDGQQSSILQTQASPDIVDLGNGTGGAIIQWNRIRNLNLQRTVTPAAGSRGLNIDNVGGYDVDHVSSQDSATLFRYHAAPNYSVSSSRYLNGGWGFGPVAASSYPSGTTLVGYEFDSLDGNPENSVVVENSTAGVLNLPANVTGIGYRIEGSAINDVDIYKPNTAGLDYGAWIKYTPTSSSTDFSAGDVLFDLPTFDSFRVSAIYVNGIAQSNSGAVNFYGGYALQDQATVSTATCAVNIGSSSGVSVTGMQVGNRSGGGFCLGIDSFLKISGNTIHDISHTASAIAGTSLTSSTVTANTIQGSPAFGLQFDATSSGVDYCGNVIDPSATVAVLDKGLDRLCGQTVFGTPSTTFSTVTLNGNNNTNGAWSTSTDHHFGFYLTPSGTLGPSTLVANISFGKTWKNAAGYTEIPYCTWSPNNAASAGLQMYSDFGPTAFSLHTGPSQSLVPGTQYAWTVTCEGDQEQ